MDPRYTCISADARSPEGYLQALPKGPAQLLCTDPPYCLLTRRRRGGDLREAKGRKVEREPSLRFESVREYREFTRAWLPLALSHIIPGAPAIIWTNFLGKEPILETARAAGYVNLWGEFVWAKRTKESSGGEQLFRAYEVALVLFQRPAPEPTAADAAIPWAAVSGYGDEGEEEKWGRHPHHKPYVALEPLLRTYSKPNDWVLDPFAGSGSIGAAALRLGRKAACLELRPEWTEQVLQRLSKAVEERT